jgi:hypothetical protein
MRFSPQVNFILIVVGSLLAAALVGFLLGLMGGGVRVAPVVSGTADPAPRAPRTEPRPAPQPQVNHGIPDEPPVVTPPAEPEPPPPVPQRQLADGRTDEIRRSSTEPPEPGRIIAEVRNHQGAAVGLGGVGLDVMAGPLGWQPTGAHAWMQRGERGVYAFQDLPPGEYRVRAESVHYAPAFEVVYLSPGAESRVTLVLRPAETATVELRPRFPDGMAPESVEVAVVIGTPGVGPRGRFAEHAENGEIDADGPRVGRYSGELENGVISNTYPVGVPLHFTLSATRDGAHYQGDVRLEARPPSTTHDIRLEPVEPAHPGQPMGALRLEVNISIAGMEAPEFTRVNLRRNLRDTAWRAPGDSSRSNFVWSNLGEGVWYLVAEARGLHAPHIERLEVRESATRTVVIQTGHVRLSVTREQGSPDPDGRPLRYGLHVLAQGHGALERVYRGQMQGKEHDYIDLILPVGDYKLRAENADDVAPVNLQPVAKDLSVQAGGSRQLEFTLRAGAGLRFRCVDARGYAIPFAEYLVSFHPAGSVPETERAAVGRASADGSVRADGVPYGEVYLHVWSRSRDWHAPDKVYRLTLPPYNSKDLGPIVIAD